MSDLQKAWAKKKLEMNGAEVFNELDEEEEDETGYLPELPEGFDDDSSSASSASSTGTVVPTPSRNLFARPLGFVDFIQKPTCITTLTVSKRAVPRGEVAGPSNRSHGRPTSRGSCSCLANQMKLATPPSPTTPTSHPPSTRDHSSSCTTAPGPPASPSPS